MHSSLSVTLSKGGTYGHNCTSCTGCYGSAFVLSIIYQLYVYLSQDTLKLYRCFSFYLPTQSDPQSLMNYSSAGHFIAIALGLPNITTIIMISDHIS